MAGSLAILRGSTSLPVLSTAQSTITTSSPDRDSLTRPATSTGSPPEGKGSESSRGMEPPGRSHKTLVPEVPSNTTTCQSLKASARTAMPVAMTYRSRKYARSTPPSSKRSARWRARVVAALRLVAGAAFVSTPLTGVGVGVAVGSAVTVRLGVGGDTHADISPISRQATAMYGIQVRISTVKDDPFVERPVRDGPWSARVSGREAPRAVGC